MRTSVALACALVCALGVAGPFLLVAPHAVAQEAVATDPPEGAGEEDAQEQAVPERVEGGDAASAEDASASDSVGGQMGEVTLEKFIPSEEISADGAVSFPVDI